MGMITFHQVAEGTAVVHRGETSDAAYFILDGQAIAGWQEDGSVRVLETLCAGDFFGEIAALTGVPRTADVVTEQASTLIKVPANLVREMAAEPQLNRLFMSRLTERMLRMNLIDAPRRGSINQEVLRDLRTPDERLEIGD
jgi:CRP-like cAMP-binding protein